MPATQLAHRAAQRLANLPTVEHLQSLRAGAARDLPPGEKYIGLKKSFAPQTSTDPQGLADA
jgi:hypothetical protein